MTVSGWRVRLLGTGGAANEWRHQACLLVERADGSGRPILLDTGNGMDVVRRLVHLGRDPREVRDIFVSHQHNDHAGGLEPLLLWCASRTRREQGGPPSGETRVYAEPRILEAIHRLFEAMAATSVIEMFEGRLHWVGLEDGISVDVAGEARLIPFLVDHAPPNGGALGCVLELGDVRLAYSGDTRPCERLVRAAQGVDVLFHEAGGLDARAEAVRRSGHSTGGDAGRAARGASVGRLILIHVPDDGLADAILGEARAAFGGPVDLADDLDTVEL